MKKLLLVLTTILLVFAGCNSQSTVKDDNSSDKESTTLTDTAESGNNAETYDDKYPFNSTTTVGDLKWIGRVIESENDQEDYSIYQLVKVDKEGKETIMYESILESLYPIISLKSDQSMGINSLILEHHQGYPEGGSIITVFFDEGEESVRATYSHFWGFIQQFTFTYPNSYDYQVDIETSNECSNYSDKSQLSEDMETDILGLKITSEDDTESFALPSPKRASCTIIDGSIQPPILRGGDIQVNQSGVSIKLPGSIKASISRNDSTKKLEINYY